MKLHGAIKLGSNSVLLNNIDTYVKRGQIRPFWPWKWTFRAIQANPSFGSSLVPFLGNSWEAKIEKKLLNSVGANGLKVKKSKIWPYRPWKITFRAIFDMWFMSPKRSFMPKKKKSYWSVSETPPPVNLDGRTDGQIDIRKAPLPFSAGGAKNCLSP